MDKEKQEEIANSFEKALKFAISEESTVEEKKEVIDFLDEYIEKCSQENKELPILALKKICDNSKDDTKTYCEEIIKKHQN